MQSKRKILILLPAVLLLAALLALVFIPSSQERLQQSVCRVRTSATYAVPLGGADTLYISLDSLDEAVASFSPDSVAAHTELTGAFVSRMGHVLTTDSAVQHCPDTLPEAQTLQRLRQADTLLTARRKNYSDALSALNEYAETHSVVDDGYNDVMAFRELTIERLSLTDSTLVLIRKALSLKAVPQALLRVRTNIVFTLTGDSTKLCADTLQAVPIARDTSGLMLFGLSQEVLPQGASRFSVYRFGVARKAWRVCGFADFGGSTARSLPDVLPLDSLLPASACEGAPRVNKVGRLCGIRLGNSYVGARRVARLMAQQHCWPVWWWLNVKSFFKSLFAADKEERRGESVRCMVRCVDIHSEGWGGSYRGQVVQNAQGSFVRSGYGEFRDALGNVFCGQWAADTLAAGTRRDSLNLYEGTFNAALQSHGLGRIRKHDGEYYCGNWKDGVRNGQGFSVQGRHMVRCGEWKKGRFRGERMIYTADRVYGIDISRYQHESGRKRYSINWDKLRITGLGSGRRVSGTADYPVSFIYIKATQGIKLLNRYYAADIRQARRHGIAAGTYHFFSPRYGGSAQAAWFLKKASVAKTDLPPVLDLEPTEKQVREMGGDGPMFREVLAWLRIVEQRTGKKPVLYVGQQFVNDHLVNAPEALRRYDVWVARYGEFKPYVKLLHWQLTPYGTVRGIHGEVDVNVFNGTRQQFDAYVSQQK